MKMEEQVCTIEQMKELKELGFDTEKASMTWLGFDNKDWMVAIHNDDCYELSAQTCVPTFSISDMLEMLPKEIEEHDIDIGYCRMFLRIDISDENLTISYRHNGIGKLENFQKYFSGGKSLRDVLYNELKLLKERNKI